MYDARAALLAIDAHTAEIMTYLLITVAAAFLYFAIAMRMALKQKVYVVPFYGSAIFLYSRMLPIEVKAEPRRVAPDLACRHGGSRERRSHERRAPCTLRTGAFAALRVNPARLSTHPSPGVP